MDHATLQLVREFVQRYCALDSKGVHVDGSFRFFSGSTARKARVARAPVAFGDLDFTYSLVIERLSDLLAAEEGHVWLRAYLTGSEHHASQIKIEGVIGSDAAEEADPYAEVASIGGALVATNKLLANLLVDATRRNERHHEHQLHAVKVTTHLALREGIADMAVRQAAVAAAIKEFAPLGQAALAAWLASQGTGASSTGDDPTATAGARVSASVGRIGQEVALLGSLLASGVPDGAQAPLESLRDLVLQLGPALGLAVAPVAAA